MVRESPWDDYARAEALADAVRRERVHQGCGNELEKAFDPSVSWFVDHTMVCQACATRDMVLRQLHQEHENDKTPPGKPEWADGRVVSVRPATEADLQAARRGDRRQVSRQ